MNIDINQITTLLISGIILKYILPPVIKFTKTHIYPKLKTNIKSIFNKYDFSHNLNDSFQYNQVNLNQNKVHSSSMIFEKKNMEQVLIFDRPINTFFINFFLTYKLLPLGSSLFCSKNGTLHKIKASQIFSNTTHISY
ncbi:MAG: hypothetical protein COB15_08665 [Flavobacteriales bacterium]|nr:MAG: hypothetical protein COB15_08665 [Flavobacteriales bacterium]